MITRLLWFVSPGILVSCLLLFIVPSIELANAAGDTTYQVQLIWATNGAKPKDKPLTDVDAKVQEKLKAVFKWKNYYEVTRKPLTVSKDGSQKLKLSDKCDIEVHDLGNSRAAVRLFGEGKLVVKKAQTVVPGEMIVLAGNSKDDTAWFVVLVPLK